MVIVKKKNTATPKKRTKTKGKTSAAKAEKVSIKSNTKKEAAAGKIQAKKGVARKVKVKKQKKVVSAVPVPVQVQKEAPKNEVKRHYRDSGRISTVRPAPRNVPTQTTDPAQPVHDGARSILEKKNKGPRKDLSGTRKVTDHHKSYPKVQDPAQKIPQEAVAEAKGPIGLEMPITVAALSQKLNVSVPQLIKTLISNGIFANVNQLLNEEIIWKVSKALGIEIRKEEDEIVKAELEAAEVDPSQLSLRPPVVTLMGHVDHGKTSLLDAIRKSDVAGKEAGKITQHIGAYNVHIEGKGLVTFLDTPGHVAFTQMRARGANVTDVVVLVVAADDGPMPQTFEAIDHAQAAGVPLIVAINKSDLPTADPNRVMTGLQKKGLMAEEWGGKTIFVKVSAKTGKGIDELLEMLLLESEILELKANPNRPAIGTILEARLSKSQGAVSTLLVQNGTLRVGDIVVAGPYCGNIRSIRNDRGKSIKEAGPSHAVEILGLPGTPDAGDVLKVVRDEQAARRIAEKRSLEIRERALKGLHAKHLSLEDLYSQVKEGKIKELKLIIKGDVQGSVEALTRSLEQIASDKIQLRVIHGSVGSVSESDIMLAAASDAIVIGFHVKPNDRAQSLIEKEGVDVRFYNIIYQAIEDVQKAMEGLLEPTSKEVFEGRTLVQQTFHSSKIGVIGGAIVRKGRLVRNHPIRVLRDNIVVFQGKLASLKRFKDDVREVQEGYDCGVVVDGFRGLRDGDVIESYRVDKVASTLS
jgi:translation initiation factor IF-2